MMVWERVNVSLLLVCERVSFFSWLQKRVSLVKDIPGKGKFCQSWSRKGYIFSSLSGKGSICSKFVREMVSFFQSLYGKGSSFVKVDMRKGLLALSFGMGKGLIFQIIGMATKRVRDPAWPSLPIPF